VDEQLSRVPLTPPKLVLTRARRRCSTTSSRIFRS
jgi:hypothetical protein